MSNVVAYVRVSTSEQVKGYSLEAQITALREWCAVQDFDIVQVYEEAGRSAKDDARPTFQKMNRDLIKRNVLASAVVVHRVDRFARNLRDLLNYKSRLTQHDLNIYSATEEYINGDSAEDRLMLHIMGALAEYDNAKRASEAQKGISAMLRLGIYPGASIPLGYVRVGEKRLARIEKDDMALLVRWAFFEFVTGDWTLSEWAKEAETQGVKSKSGGPVPAVSWQKIFRNPFYTGKFLWKGILYEGEHPAIIEQSAFDEVQKVLDKGNSGGKKESHFWLFKNLLWSDVHQKPMNGTLVKGQYAYYRAKRKGKPEHNIRANELEANIVHLLTKIRATGQPLPVPEAWEWGIHAVDNMGQMWDVLPNLTIQQQFLNLVFFQKGILVDLSGRVRVERVKAGFEVRL